MPNGCSRERESVCVNNNNEEQKGDHQMGEVPRKQKKMKEEKTEQRTIEGSEINKQEMHRTRSRRCNHTVVHRHQDSERT
jgi:hypothetical protein